MEDEIARERFVIVTASCSVTCSQVAEIIIFLSGELKRVLWYQNGAIAALQVRS
jgi:hypothetical protein